MFFRTESIFTVFVRRTDVFGNLWMFRCVMILKVILMLAKYHAITGHNLFSRTSIYLGINIFPFTSVKTPIPLKDKHPQIITLTYAGKVGIINLDGYLHLLSSRHKYGCLIHQLSDFHQNIYTEQNKKRIIFIYHFLG